jgi:molecular chaperone GrpE
MTNHPLSQIYLQNAKVRSQKEGENIRRFALQSFLLTLLPTIDHFTRSLSHLPKDLEDHEWVKGILAIEKELSRTLESVGLQKIDALGKSIDPDVHEVLLTAPGNEGEVVEIVEDGFLLHGSVLRPAKVKAGSG